MLDREHSLALALKLVNHIEPPYLLSSYQSHRCWANAVKAMRLYHKQLGNVMYVEGWCAVLDLPRVTEHGWLELEDGTILDPTYVRDDTEDGIQGNYEYFSALRYSLQALKGVRLRSLPRVYRTHGVFGRHSEEYEAARNNAYRRIGR